jgi:hypothetical protein
VSADILRATADRFVSLGLVEAGYEFINTDDCWSMNARDPATGRIIPGLNFGGKESSMKNLSACVQKIRTFCAFCFLLSSIDIKATKLFFVFVCYSTMFFSMMRSIGRLSTISLAFHTLAA